MHKKARQDAILDLIATVPLGSQKSLATMLSQKGFSVTQASISRDLDELNIAKVGGRYVRQTATSVVGIAEKASFDTAGPNLIVGRCAAGLASAITVMIDSLNLSQIVGTIAGDDTVFIAVKDSESQTVVIEYLAELFG